MTDEAGKDRSLDPVVSALATRGPSYDLGWWRGFAVGLLLGLCACYVVLALVSR
jgi:hypothetical protein